LVQVYEVIQAFNTAWISVTEINKKSFTFPLKPNKRILQENDLKKMQFVSKVMMPVFGSSRPDSGIGI
jgi:hypothetical protein